MTKRNLLKLRTGHPRKKNNKKASHKGRWKEKYQITNSIHIFNHTELFILDLKKKKRKAITYMIMKPHLKVWLSNLKNLKRLPYQIEEAKLETVLEISGILIWQRIKDTLVGKARNCSSNLWHIDLTKN